MVPRTPCRPISPRARSAPVRVKVFIGSHQQTDPNQQGEKQRTAPDDIGEEERDDNGSGEKTLEVGRKGGAQNRSFRTVWRRGYFAVEFVPRSTRIFFPGFDIR